MKVLVVLALVLLVSCVPIPEAPPVEKPVGEKVVETEVAIKRTPEVVETLTQTGARNVKYGFDKYDDLVSIEGPEGKIAFEYDEYGKLVSIGEGLINFTYKGDKLIRVDREFDSVDLEYNSFGDLVKIDDHDVHKFKYDANARLIEHQRGNAPPTKFEIEGNNTLKTTRSTITTIFRYNEDDLIRDVDRNDNHISIGYGRENKIASFSGSIYGVGETISYNPNSIEIVSNERPAEFTGHYRIRPKLFELYMYCNMLRRVPVLFDPIAYVLANHHLGYDTHDYFVKGYYCEFVK